MPGWPSLRVTLESELIPESESGETGKDTGCGGGGRRIRGRPARPRAGGQHRGKEPNGLIDAMTISSKSTDKTRHRSSTRPALLASSSFEGSLFIRKMGEYLWRFDIIREHNGGEGEGGGLFRPPSRIPLMSERAVAQSLPGEFGMRDPAAAMLPMLQSVPMGFPSLLGCWFCRRCICQFRRLNPLISPLLKGGPPQSRLPPSLPRRLRAHSLPSR